MLILLIKKISVDFNLFQILGAWRQKFRSIGYISNYTSTDIFTDLSIPYILNCFKLQRLRQLLLYIFLLLLIAQFFQLHSSAFQIKERDALRWFCNIVLSSLILLEWRQGFSLNIQDFIMLFFLSTRMCYFFGVDGGSDSFRMQLIPLSSDVLIFFPLLLFVQM